MAKKRKRKKSKRKKQDQHGTDSSVDTQLDELFEETWDDIEARTFDEVPDGTYQVRVLAASLNNSQTSDRLQCSWELLILEGDSKGRHLFIHQGLDTEDGVAYFKGSLGRLGHEAPDSKKKLVATLEDIVEGPTYASVRTSTRKKRVDGETKEFQNKRFIKALDSDEVEDDFSEEDLNATSNSSTEEIVWEKGDSVKVKVDDEYYEGTIKKVKKDSAEVLFEDGDKLDIPLDELEETENTNKNTPEDEPTWEKGTRVKAKVDGEFYEGVIKKVKKDSADVLFDDGDKLNVAFEDMEALGSDPSKGSTEDSCTLASKKFNPVDNRELKKLAKENNFDPDNFDNFGDLLCEIGDYCGLSGEFKKPVTLIKALKEQAE